MTSKHHENNEYSDSLGELAQLALDTLHQKPVQGIPHKNVGVMEDRMIDRLAGVPEGTYRRKPIDTSRRT